MAVLLRALALSLTPRERWKGSCQPHSCCAQPALCYARCCKAKGIQVLLLLQGFWCTFRCMVGTVESALQRRTVGTKGVHIPSGKSFVLHHFLPSLCLQLCIGVPTPVLSTPGARGEDAKMRATLDINIYTCH